MVQEQLAGVNFPSDAVGATTLVAGAIVMSADGKVLPGQSRLTVDLRGLTSDDSRRDRFLRNTTLRTVLYPTAEFVPAEAVGLAWPLPTSGSATFQLKGDMTVRGVTKPLTWDVTATFSDAQVAGAATTAFTFADFGLSVPRVFLVLSVEETIRLKVDFQLSVTRAG
jgi:polyisoprenoid-binding protein YceI